MPLNNKIKTAALLTKSADKNLPLESIRGIASTCVALYHFQTLSPLTNNAFIEHSFLMVDLFFVLSGYVIALNYLDRIVDFSSLVRFQLRRFWRLYPLHFATLMLYVLLEFAKYVFQQKTGISPNDIPFERNNLFAFINHLLMTHAIFPEQITFNTRSWSISTEFYAYLTFGLVLLVTKKRFFPVAALLISVISLCVVIYGSNTLYVTTRLAFPRCLCSFFMGSLLFILTSKFKFKSNSFLIALSLVLSILSVVYMAGTRFEYYVPFVFALLIYNLACADCSGLVYRILSHRYLVFLGTISYSVYLLHAFVWFCFRQLGRFVFHVPVIVEHDDRARVIFSPVMGTIITMVGLVIIFAISYWSYVHIESRFRRGIKQGGSNK